MEVWMYVTKDKYELTLIVADTSAELARKLGIHPDRIRSALCHARQRGGKSRYVKVNIDDINE